MISICIPIYNFNVVKLVEKLNDLSKSLPIPSEIILIDDCSDIFFKEENEDVCGKYHYIKLEKNIGRAAIRNRFLQFAKFDYLLYLDCDSVIVNDDFIFTYLDAAYNFSDLVFCGGTIYTKQKPELNCRLRWIYGVKREIKPYYKRQQNPNKSFMTHHFLIHKKVFDVVKFDERLHEYGHEDTFFGYQLRKHGIMVRHVNNPIINGHLQTNREYILNVENSISNLVKLLCFTKSDKDFIDNVSLLKAYYLMGGAMFLVKYIFLITKPILRKLLSLGVTNLYLFDFYKLGILTLKMKDKDIKSCYN